MSITFDTFDFKGYANSGLSSFDVDPDQELQEEQKQQLYSEFIDGYARDLSESDRFKGSDNNQVLLQTLDDIPDARPFIGLPEPDEDYQINPDNFMAYVYDNNKEGLYEENQVGLYRDSYLDNLIDNPSHPQFRVPPGVSESDYRKSLSERLDNAFIETPYNTQGTVGENRSLFDTRFDRQQETIAQQTTTDEVSGLESAGRAFIGQGVLDTLGKAVEGISSLGNTIGTKFGDIRIGTRDDEGNFKLFDYYTAEEMQQAVAEHGLSGDLIGRLGQSIQDLGADIAEEGNEESIWFKAASIAGQLATYIGGGFAGGLARGTAGAVATTGSLGVTSGSQYQVDDYEQTLLANGEKFDPDAAANTALWGGAFGALEAVPGFKAAGRFLGFVDSPTFLKFLNDETNGRIVTALKRGSVGAFEEGLQEVVSEYASNQVAKNIVGYDPDRDVYSGLVEAGEVGSAAGFTINALLGLIDGRRIAQSQPTDTTNDSQPERVAPEFDQTTDTSQPNVEPVETVNQPNTAVSEPDQTDTGEIVTNTESEQTTNTQETTVFTPQTVGNQNGYASQGSAQRAIQVRKDTSDLVINQDYQIIENDGRFFAETIEQPILEPGQSDLNSISATAGNSEVFFRGHDADSAVSTNDFTFASSSPIAARTYTQRGGNVSQIAVSNENQLTIDLKGGDFTENSLDATVTDDKGKSFKLSQLFGDLDTNVVDTNTVTKAAQLNGYDSVRFENIVDIGGRAGLLDVTNEVERDVFNQENPNQNYDEVVQTDPQDPRIVRAKEVATESVGRPTTVVATINPQVRQGTIDSDYQIDFARKIAGYAAPRQNAELFSLADDGTATLTAGNADGVDVDIVLSDRESINDVLVNAEVSSTLNSINSVTDTSTIGEWVPSDLDPYLDALPPRIRDLINIHTTAENNPLVGTNATGRISFSGPDGVQINIDARPSERSLSDVVNTISHEVAHFGLDSWGDARFQKMYDRAFEILKPRIGAELKPYLRHYNVTVDATTPATRWMLVHEYFAKHNSTLLDIKSGSMDGVLTEQQFNQLQKDVIDNGAVSIIQDLTSGSDQPSREFIENIVKAQTAATSNRKLHVTYLQDGLNGKKRRVQIRTTPSGKTINVSNNDADSQHFARLINLHANAKDNNDLVSKVNLGLDRYVKGFVGEQFLGNKITNISSGGLQAMLRNRVNGLRDASNKHKGISARLKTEEGASRFSHIDSLIKKTRNFDSESELSTAPVFDFTVSENETYEKRLSNAGIKKSRYVKDARELDQLITEGNAAVIDGVREIQAAITKSERLAAAMVAVHSNDNRSGNTSNTLNEMITEVRDFKNRFTEDYRHREYRSFTPDGVRLVQDILTDFTAPNKVGRGVEDRVSQAIKDVAIVKADLRDGKITEKSAINKINKLEPIINLGHRKKIIQLWAREQAGPDANQSQVNQVVIDYLSKHVEDHDPKQSSLRSTDKLQLVDGVRGRTLNENVATDRLLMKFLDPVTEPLEVLIGTREQQNKTLAILNWANDYSEVLFRSGIARFKGADATNSWRGSPILQKYQKGSILAHIEVPEFIAEETNSMFKTIDAVEENWIERLFAYTKKNLTVQNIDLGASNYVSSAFLSGMGGHYAYLNRFGTAGRGIKELWDRRNRVGVTENETYPQLIARELEENYLSNAGVTSLDVEVGRTDLFEKLVTGVMDFTGNPGGEATRVETRRKLEKINDALETAYSFGDDYSKVLPYILNRELAVAKAETVILRDNYPNTEKGKQQYDRDILRMAVPEAVNRTSRETFVWSLAPTWFKSLARAKWHPFTSNFMMHPQQFLRIMVDSHRLWFEDISEYTRAVKEGHKEYANVLGGRIAARTAGLALTDATNYAVIAGGIPLASQGISSLLDAINEDQEVEDNEIVLSGEKLQAVQTIAHRFSYDGSSLYTPVRQIVDTDKWEVTMWNNARTNINLSLAVPPDSDSGEFSFENSVWGFVNKFAGNKDDNSNLIRKFIRLTDQQPEDQYGNEITKSKAFLELGESFAPIPTWVKDAFYHKPAAIYDVVNGVSIENPNEDQIKAMQDGVSELISTTGTKVRVFDLKKTVRSHGYDLARQWSSFSRNADIKSNLSRLMSGDLLTTEQTADIVSEMIDVADEMDTGNLTFVQAYQQLGMSNEEIQGFMTSRDDKRKVASRIAGKDQVNALLQGRSIFRDRVSKVITDAIDDQKVNINRANVDIDAVRNNIKSLTLALAHVR